MKKTIVLSVFLSLFLVGCSENAKEEVTQVETKKVEVSAQTQAPTPVEVKAPAPTVAQIQADALEVAANSVEIVKDEFARVSDATKELSDSVAESAAVTATQTIQEVQAVLAEVEKSIPVIESKPSIDAKKLYATCVGCHGTIGEKVALGKSKIIRDMTVAEITTALNGYKDGTYGGAMKGIMKGQASKLSADEIKAIAELISSK